MKFSCTTSDLLQALQLVSRAISGQQALPILGNVLLEAEGKRCTISATDLELSIVTSIEADIENEGAITVPAKAFLNFAQYNSDDRVLLETSEGTQLKCTSTQAKTVIAGETAQEYPTISTIKKEQAFSFDVEPLLEALHFVTFASAKTTLRPVLSGVYIREEKGNLVFVATDSYRLSEISIPTNSAGGEISCIVPTKVLEELRNILGAHKSDSKKGDKKDSETETKKIDVVLSNQQIEVHIGQTTLLSRLIEGKFPDYQQIIPKDNSTVSVLPTKELVTTVKRMHYFAKEANNNLTFKLSKESVHIATPQTQAGQDETTLAAGVSGEDNKIALSSSYLLDFLGHVDCPELEMHLTDSMHPAVFRIPGNDRFLHLIMPLRIQED
ncbi:DNA polymerase III subunit beta [Candidatus Peregrinibacteria bacterium]|jgi:DNA polymerase III subunit beta|nr:DNA polymerase III subunit beta [Candidatus Peregrinibacteria bacterium]MBT3598216.1 DNA polymerase III subunit beta [Candidatus Peregrinibacteria bacterium]MBT4367641.1 DNA polymerase III subunit beta [Candidatus Peregrinibacteria bacterium]MBT4585650.1 DNA polymerase III subunit beta [Candidatus Peregrinibacteria bacterium]MBT6730924.1 DNA polymerase III subunit beta [Candidatus Peregrinibacteria bacterium]